MTAPRITVHAATTAGIAELLQFAWRFARWIHAEVDAHAAAPVPAATTLRRIGRARGDDLLIAELPDDPSARITLAQLLMQQERRALLLPSGGDSPWTFAGWSSDTGTAALASEAALLAIVVEQHLRWGRSGDHGWEGDPIALTAAESVFSGLASSWLAPGSPDRRRGRPLPLRTLTAGGASADAFRSGRSDVGWIVVPRRSPCRLAGAWDRGLVVATPADATSAPELDAMMTVAAGRDGQRWRIAQPPPPGGAEVIIGIRGRSLLDPAMHAAWECLRELLAMPRLREDLLRARDAASLRSVLLLDEETLSSGDRIATR